MNSLTLDFVLLEQKSMLEKPTLLAAEAAPRAAFVEENFNGTARLLCEKKLYLAGKSFE